MVWGRIIAYSNVGCPITNEKIKLSKTLTFNFLHNTIIYGATKHFENLSYLSKQSERLIVCEHVRKELQQSNWESDKDTQWVFEWEEHCTERKTERFPLMFLTLHFEL